MVRERGDDCRDGNPRSVTSSGAGDPTYASMSPNCASSGGGWIDFLIYEFVFSGWMFCN